MSELLQLLSGNLLVVLREEPEVDAFVDATWTCRKDVTVRPYLSRVTSLLWGQFIGDSKSYLSGLPWLRINVWAYFGGFFWHFLL